MDDVAAVAAGNDGHVRQARRVSQAALVLHAGGQVRLLRPLPAPPHRLPKSLCAHPARAPHHRPLCRRLYHAQLVQRAADRHHVPSDPERSEGDARVLVQIRVYCASAPCGAPKECGETVKGQSLWVL